MHIFIYFLGLITVNYLIAFGTESFLIFVGITRLMLSPLYSHTIFSYYKVALCWLVIILFPLSRDFFCNSWIKEEIEVEHISLDKYKWDIEWVKSNYHNLIRKNIKLDQLGFFVSKDVKTWRIYDSCIYINKSLMNCFSENVSALILVILLCRSQKKSILVPVAFGFNFFVELTNYFFRGVRTVLKVFSEVPYVGKLIFNIGILLLFIPNKVVGYCITIEHKIQEQIEDMIYEEACEMVKK